ncbi:bifunctional 5,10-methylenetetrahydrofolate dehydrogenase/5,10-methenyltetrahydrofolate cyclohydrolase [Candidatus Saccharibacteria bacterium]|nr:bifunctional 5,10-methylenetetrahydrofolate dehydrogenase/5,10-methenyltetrahydrofolate cyclohydrolase [Candidatus Saccharibacteria bacterium]
MKILNGQELAGYIKERQARQVRGLKNPPKLLILRDSDNPVITKYVNLKIRYGEDIGIDVVDICTNIQKEVIRSNSDPSVHGIIIQLPLKDPSSTDTLCDLITPTKDVDGLGKNADYDSATATAINWLLAGYDIDLKTKHIAIVGRGKLVGAPLYRMYQNSNYDVDLFHRGSDLAKLKDYDVIITATGQPGLITSSMISPGAIVIDAGTASEDGRLKGDLAPEVRTRQDLAAITPKKGGVGPLTVACLFDHVVKSASKPHSKK